MKTAIKLVLIDLVIAQIVAPVRRGSQPDGGTR